MKITLEDLKNAIDTSDTMSQASSKLGLHFNTFKRYAVKHGLYNPNQSGKGTKKPKALTYKLDDILKGDVPHFQTNKLRLRLLSENVFEHKCQQCELTEWNGQPIPLELDHINGVRNDHKLENLRLLCPNCHAQTDTYRGKNR